MKKNSLRVLVSTWNKKFPVDRYWREKHKVPFNSSSHRTVNYIDMVTEFVEDMMLLEAAQGDKTQEDRQYYLETGQWLKPKPGIKMNQKEIDQEFDDLDISQFNDENSDVLTLT